MVLPLNPICASLAIKPAFTAVLVAPIAAFNLLANSPINIKLSLFCKPLPPATTILAVVNSNCWLDFINSKKITLNDVMGKNLPPIPDQKLNNSTVAGIDANKNYIRDDVELAIFKQYPNSAEIRAAELQYAQSLQLELTQVYSSKTLVAVMKKESHAIDCIGQNGPDISLKDSREKIIAALAVTDNMQKEVEGLALNTDLRKKENSNILEKYMTGYASLPGNECDIELSSLPN